MKLKVYLNHTKQYELIYMIIYLQVGSLFTKLKVYLNHTKQYELIHMIIYLQVGSLFTKLGCTPSIMVKFLRYYNLTYLICIL